jgi:hypothetical protein
MTVLIAENITSRRVLMQGLPARGQQKGEFRADPRSIPAALLSWEEELGSGACKRQIEGRECEV